MKVHLIGLKEDGVHPEIEKLKETFKATSVNTETNGDYKIDVIFDFNNPENCCNFISEIFKTNTPIKSYFDSRTPVVHFEEWLCEWKKKRVMHSQNHFKNNQKDSRYINKPQRNEKRKIKFSSSTQQSTFVSTQSQTAPEISKENISDKNISTDQINNIDMFFKNYDLYCDASDNEKEKILDRVIRTELKEEEKMKDLLSN